MVHLKSKILNLLSTLLHGKPKPVYAQVSYLESEKLLQGQKIIITGGGRGLGYAMAKKFLAEGAEILISGRNEATLKQVSEELGCSYLKFDVSDTHNAGQFIKEADEKLGGVNVLVNNAGISLHENTFFEVTPETFQKQIATNLEGPFFLTQSFIKLMLEKKQAAEVLFVSSETGDTVDFRPYGFTKGAINSMVKGLAYLFKNKHIRINAIAPGVTASDMTGVDKDGNLYAGGYGEGRYYLPEEVAQVATLILSDAMGIVSGQIITCNNAQTVNARWKN